MDRVILLEFSKEFDKVSYQPLRAKLKCYGVCSNLLNLIADF